MFKYLSFISLILLGCAAKGQVKIDPSNKNIVYWGRVDFTDPQAPAFEYSGVTIKGKFTGTSLSVQLNDYANHGVSTTNYFYKIIDGGSPQKFEALKGINSYTLASGLNSGSHTVELIKLTEANVGKTAFLGFTLETGASMQPFSDQPACSIEFIGNSITCGYGNELSIQSEPNTGFQSINENNYKAWGYVAARNLGMKYSAVSYSGRGLYRNNTGSTVGILPAIYDRIFPDNAASPLWNHATHPLNYVVVNLGTNDFAQDPANPVNQTTFEATYVQFVEKLKGYHSNAKIILAVGVMMSDNYPSGAQHWTKIRSYVKNVVNTLRTKGIKDIFYFEMDPQQPPYGEDWHPSAVTHARMASALTTFINGMPKTCADTSILSVKPITSKSIQLFPNPTNTVINLSYEGEELEWEVFGNTGQSYGRGKGKSIDTSTYPAGTYQLKIADQVFKIVK